MVLVKIVDEKETLKSIYVCKNKSKAERFREWEELSLPVASLAH